MPAPSSNPSTPLTLLERLRQPGDAAAWGQFAELYTPLLFYWARKTGLQESDAADLVQEIFAVLVRALPEFRYEAGGSFRGWLRTVLRNKWRELHRRKAPPLRQAVALDEIPDPHPDDPLDDPAGRSELLDRALELLRPEFQPATWKAFWEAVVLGRPPRAVAAELGLSLNAVYIAKSRVLHRLRQETDGLLG